VDGKSLRDAADKAASASRSSSVSPRAARKAARLLRRSEFDAVYREGRRRSSQYFVAFLRLNGLEQSRFGLSVPRALGSAATRNRLRRRIREIVRLNRPRIPTGWDMVIHPRSSAVATAEFGPLAAELVALVNSVQRAGHPSIRRGGLSASGAESS